MTAESAVIHEVRATEKITLEFEQKALAALINFAGKQDIRYYINGLFFSVKDGKTAIVATNGHVLGVIYDAIQTDAKDVELIVPRHAIEIAIKAGKTIGKHCPGVIEIDGDRTTLLWNRTEGIVFSRLEGKFPDFEKIVPKEVSGEVSAINWGYLRAFETAAKILTGVKTWQPPTIGYNGNAAALITVPAYPAFAGVAMPIRT